MKTSYATKLLFCLVLVFALLSPSRPVSAGQITNEYNVDSFEDLPDVAVGNAVCSAGVDTGGPCTLRAALQEASNANSMGENAIIKVPPGTYQLTLEPDPDVPDQPEEEFRDLDLILTNTTANLSVTIEGAGPGPSIIDAAQIDRVLQINAEGDAQYRHQVILRNLVIRNGLIHTTTDDSVYGGGIRSTSVNLTLENVRFIDNEVRGRVQGSGFEPGYGGGLAVSYANLVLSDSEFAGNKADTGSALYTWDGSNPLTYFFLVQRSSFHHNECADQLSVIESYGKLYLINSTVAQNSTRGNFFVGVNSSRSAVIHSSTLQIAGRGENLSCRFHPCSLRNSVLKTDQINGVYATNCSVSSTTINSEGGNVLDDHSCNEKPALNDLVIPRENWKMSFEGKFYLPAGGSPVIDHVSGKCRAMGFYQSAELTDEVLTNDQRKLPRNDMRCDAGSIEVQKFLYLPIVLK